MKIKSLFFTLAGVLLIQSGMAQAKITIPSGTDTFTATEKGSVTKFIFEGTAEELKDMKEKAVALKDRLQLEFTKNDQGGYNAVMVVDHQPQAEYVQKMFITLGVKTFFVEGAEMSVQELSGVLYNMN